MILPSVNAMLPYDMTQAQGALVRRSTSSSPATPFAFPVKSQWSPGDIGTLVFGFIASILGVLTLWVTFRLGHQRASHAVGNGESSELGEAYDSDIPLEPIRLERDPLGDVLTDGRRAS